MNSKQVADPVTILQTLIRFDTTTPPGKERNSNDSLNFGTSVINNTLLNYGGYVQ